MFEIGNSLREARLRQRLDFPQLEQTTKIRGKYLRALEEEEFEVLPGQTYVRGFLRTYAESLGLDGQLYVDEYNSRYVVDEEPLRPRRSRARQQRRVESKVVLVALLGIAIVTALVIGAWKFGGGDGGSVLPPATVTGSTINTAQAPPAALAIRGLRGGSEVTVRLGSSTGKPRWSGTLQAGDVQRFTQRRLWIWIRTPRNVHVTVSGQSIGLHGRGPLAAVVAHGRFTRTGR